MFCFWRRVVCNGTSYKFLQLQFPRKALHSSALQSGQSSNGSNMRHIAGEATAPRLNSSVSFFTGALRFEDRRKEEKGLACQDVPIYSIFLCQLPRFCFPFPQACFPSTNFYFHNSYILHHFFRLFSSSFFCFLSIIFPSLSIRVFSILLPSIFILNFFLHESDFSPLSWKKSALLKGRSVSVLRYNLQKKYD